MRSDIEYLVTKCGGDFELYDDNLCMFYYNLEHDLTNAVINNTLACQILENAHCERWEVIKDEG
jgi:hypothetical protein